jgi:hypothetical protein
MWSRTSIPQDVIVLDKDQDESEIIWIMVFCDDCNVLVYVDGCVFGLVICVYICIFRTFDC